MISRRRHSWRNAENGWGSHDSVVDAINNGSIPRDWGEAIVGPIYKGGGGWDCSVVKN